MLPNCSKAVSSDNSLTLVHGVHCVVHEVEPFSDSTFIVGSNTVMHASRGFLELVEYDEQEVVFLSEINGCFRTNKVWKDLGSWSMYGL